MVREKKSQYALWSEVHLNWKVTQRQWLSGWQVDQKYSDSTEAGIRPILLRQVEDPSYWGRYKTHPTEAGIRPILLRQA